MARLDKIKARFKACRGPFPWDDFESLLGGLGYRRIDKSGGSQRRYYNEASGHLIMLHEPHDGEMGSAMVKRLQTELREKGAL
jgi:hypothetical protein